MATFWIAYNFQIQKRIVSTETIWGNTVFMCCPHCIKTLSQVSFPLKVQLISMFACLAMINNICGYFKPRRRHSGSRCLNSTKNKFPRCDFTNWVSGDLHSFRVRSLHALHIQNLSKYCRHTKVLSIISQFNKCTNLIFGGCSPFDPTVRHGPHATT